MNTDLIREICKAHDEGVPVEEWESKPDERVSWSGYTSYRGLLDAAMSGWYVRRKPRTVTRTITYPEPIREAPKRDSQIFVASATYQEFYFQTTWTGCEWDRRTFDRGLIHLTTEAAAAHGRAMAEEQP